MTLGNRDKTESLGGGAEQKTGSEEHRKKGREGWSEGEMEGGWEGSPQDCWRHEMHLFMTRGQVPGGDRKGKKRIVSRQKVTGLFITHGLT